MKALRVSSVAAILGLALASCGAEIDGEQAEFEFLEEIGDEESAISLSDLGTQEVRLYRHNTFNDRLIRVTSGGGVTWENTVLKCYNLGANTKRVSNLNFVGPAPGDRALTSILAKGGGAHSGGGAGSYVIATIALYAGHNGTQYYRSYNADPKGLAVARVEENDRARSLCVSFWVHAL